MKRTLIPIIFLLALAGCITLDHRVACTVAKDKAFAVMGVGVGDVKFSFDVNELDRAAICPVAPIVTPSAPVSAASAPAFVASAPK